VTLIIPIPLLSPVCRDTDDDEILSTAKTAGCSVIVTGDKDLTVLKQFGEIKIVTPSDFWRFESEIHS
jgi:predicted nucleic acid-binding protein